MIRITQKMSSLPDERAPCLNDNTYGRHEQTDRIVPDHTLAAIDE